MRLATFLPSDAGAPLAGEVRDERVVAFADGSSVLDRLTSGDRAPADGPEYALADVTLLAPVPRPRAIF
jgi:acylpyruvate hydrolase